MAVNLIVLAVTLLMAAFVGVWIFCPRLRTWMELPKYHFLDVQRRFPSVRRDREPGVGDRKATTAEMLSQGELGN